MCFIPSGTVPFQPAPESHLLDLNNSHETPAEEFRTLRDTLAEGVKRRRREPRETIWALREVSFAVEKGEAIGVIGANGAGKTTLLEIITGRIAPDGGSVEVGKTVRFGYSDQENRAIYGKCDNPNGHGHNYTLEVTIEIGDPTR